MMTEISLNVLDVTENSIRAGATLIEIIISIHTNEDKLFVTIKDNGCGMTKEQVDHVIDPFFTTRTTRKVGLGIPFFKQAAESTGGSLTITSVPREGTIVKAIFTLSHIDRMPIGDMTSTIHTLVTMNKTVDFIYSYSVDSNEFTLNTKEFREILGDIPFSTPDVSNYIKEFLIENHEDINKGKTM